MMHQPIDVSTMWCILRTSGARTIALAESLAEVDFEAWTPIEERARLAGRKRELVEQKIAMLPGYVFARMSDVEALLALSRSPSLNYQVWDSEKRKMVTKGHPYFSVFHMNGYVRPQADKSLAPLRALEEGFRAAAERRRKKALQKGQPPRFFAGQVVRVSSGGFEGLDLKVVADSVGNSVKLTHPSWAWDLDISAWKLRDIQVEHGSAALAA